MSGTTFGIKGFRHQRPHQKYSFALLTCCITPNVHDSRFRTRARSKKIAVLLGFTCFMTDTQPKRLLVTTGSLILLRGTHALRCMCVNWHNFKKKGAYTKQTLNISSLVENSACLPRNRAVSSVLQRAKGTPQPRDEITSKKDTCLLSIVTLIVFVFFASNVVVKKSW